MFEIPSVSVSQLGRMKPSLVSFSPDGEDYGARLCAYPLCASFAGGRLVALLSDRIKVNDRDCGKVTKDPKYKGMGFPKKLSGGGIDTFLRRETLRGSILFNWQNYKQRLANKRFNQKRRRKIRSRKEVPHWSVAILKESKNAQSLLMGESAMVAWRRIL